MREVEACHGCSAAIEPAIRRMKSEGRLARCGLLGGHRPADGMPGNLTKAMQACVWAIEDG